MLAGALPMLAKLPQFDRMLEAVVKSIVEARQLEISTTRKYECKDGRLGCDTLDR